MGEVYAGFDETLKRRVALKAIRAEHRLSAASKARFLREARILSRLDHPHICRVYDFIEGAEGDWLVLELIEGKTLQTALAGGLDPSRLAIARRSPTCWSRPTPPASCIATSSRPTSC